jgi:UDP-N-acetyl-D-mannosaminuronic acid dehydrogenase
MHFPGAGVGGHCITKDPWLLVYGVEGRDVPLRLIPAARAVNDSMPTHMVKLLRQALRFVSTELDGSRVLVLGYAYLEDSDDTRNSPSESLVQSLQMLGAEAVIHDPYVSQYRGDVYQKASGCDAVLLMVAHQEYRQLDLDRLRAIVEPGVLVDGRAVFDPYLAKKAGFIYRRVGRAQD